MNEQLKKEATEAVRGSILSSLNRGDISRDKVGKIISKYIDKATLAERERILKSLRANWTELVASNMAAKMKGNEDEQWEAVAQAIGKETV